ncbi:hypothetical protein WDW37_06020 [Bdellovibrionota bacterium FG-1]
MSKKLSKQIRVIEWDSSKTHTKTQDFGESDISSDIFQILEWVLRQVLAERGIKIGFDKSVPKVRIKNYNTIAQYVQAVICEIDRYEQERRIRFNAAVEYFDHFRGEEDDINLSWVKKLESEIGLTGQGATFGQWLTVERPANLLRYGLERLYYPISCDRDCLVGVKDPSEKQLKALRRKLGAMGRYLVKTEDGWLSLDFSKSPFIRELIFGAYAVFSPYFKPADREDPQTFPLAPFINKKLGFMFRDDRSVNARPGTLRRTLTARVIRERLHGNKKLRAQYKDDLAILGLTSDAFYAYLKQSNGKLRPSSSPYLTG